MKKDKLKNLFDFLPKSPKKAGDGLTNGKYPFYTSSEHQTKYLVNSSLLIQAELEAKLYS